MTSIEEARKLMPEETKGMSDKEVEDLVFITNMLVEMAYDSWEAERKKKYQEAKKSQAVK